MRNALPFDQYGLYILPVYLEVTVTVKLEMHDEIFHFEIFKKIMEIFKYFKNPSLKYFTKFLIVIIT